MGAAAHEQLDGVTLADTYLVQSLIGTGAGGRVYVAEQTNLRRRVAIKVLHQARTEDDLERFRTEARAASRLNHPNTVAIYDFGVTDGGSPYLVMEFLRGRTLREVLADEPLSVERAVSIAAQVLSALDEAHEAGIVHRDLKSDNIIVTQRRDGSDFVKVIDFGLAQIGEAPERAAEIAGTPEYMSPEQIRGDHVGPKADLYAVGTLLYEMIVGRTPFAGNTVIQTLQSHLLDSPVPPHRVIPSCPHGVSDIAMEAMAKSPWDRPLSAGVMRDKLLSELRRGTRARAAVEAAPGVPIETARVAVGSAPTRRQRRASLPMPEFDGLIGRDEEIARLTDFILGAEDGGALVLIGPTGIGKQRLLRAATGRIDDVNAFFAGPDPTGLQAPWYPVLSLLEAVLDLGARLDYETLASAAARSGVAERDVPGLAELFGLSGPLESLELAVRRRETRVAALRTLESVARRFPRALLCLTDAHLFDRPSAELLAALCESLDGSGTRVVATVDRAEAVPPGAGELELGPLSDAAAMRLLATFAREVTLPSPQELREVTGGVPGAIEQLGAELASGANIDTGLSGFEELVSARVCELEPGERRVLQHIAVHGTTVDRSVLLASVGDDRVAAGEAVDTLAKARILSIEGDQISFRSKVFADIVLASTPRAARALLHRHALAALSQVDAVVATSVLAHHLELAGDREDAYNPLLLAGDDAVRRFDDIGARRWYGRAVSCGRRLCMAGAEGGVDMLVEASVRLADVLRFGRELSLATSVLEEAEAAARDLRTPPELVRAQARIRLARGDADGAIEQLRRSIGIALQAGKVDFVCETYLDLAAALGDSGSPAEAARELREGVDMVTLGEGFAAESAPDRLWLLGLRLAEFLQQAGQLEDAAAVAFASMAHAERCSSRQAPARILELRAAIAFELGDPRALEYRARAIELVRELGDRRSTAELLIANVTASMRLEPMRGARETQEVRERALAVARELAEEIGWREGIELSDAAADG